MASISHLPAPVDLDLSVAETLSDATLRQRITEYGDCLGAANPDEWFPTEPRTEEAQAEYEQTARELCADCPVIAECLGGCRHDEQPPLA